MVKLAWHYTTGQKFIKIVQSGLLIPTQVGVEDHEAPVLWFSQNPIWEPTACKGMIDAQGNNRTLSRHETREYGGGLVRFGFPARQLLPWKRLRVAANIRKHTRIGLERAGRMMLANPDEWMGLLKPIPVSDLVVDVLEGEWSWERVGHAKPRRSSSNRSSSSRPSGISVGVASRSSCISSEIQT